MSGLYYYVSESFRKVLLGVRVLLGSRKWLLGVRKVLPGVRKVLERYY